MLKEDDKLHNLVVMDCVYGPLSKLLDKDSIRVFNKLTDIVLDIADRHQLLLNGAIAKDIKDQFMVFYNNKANLDKLGVIYVNNLIKLKLF